MNTKTAAESMILTEVEICTAVVLPHCVVRNKFSLYFIKYLLSTYYIKIFQSKFVYCNEINILHNVPVPFFFF